MSAFEHTARKLPSGMVALKKIVEGTATHTGGEFFRSLVKNLAEALDAHGVWVSEFIPDTKRLRALAFWMDGEFVEQYEYSVEGTPCEPSLKHDGLFHIADNIVDLFPTDRSDLEAKGAVSYLGFPLKDEEGVILGHLALLDNKPMEEIPEAFAIFRIFASRAEAELRRHRYEQRLIEKESKLYRLVNGMMDAMFELNERLIITQFNRAALKAFGEKKEFLSGNPISEYFDAPSFKKLTSAISALERSDSEAQSSLIPGALQCIRKNGKTFPAEAALSKYTNDGKNYYGLFIRNMEEKVRAQENIKMLNVEASMLREKVESSGISDIVGASEKMRHCIRQINQVAATDATVLIRGETGTGKELVARAIHKASPRKNKPMVMLNCAALPSELIESELFGHVKGAFTGAAGAREGRFSLAEGGTIFLDEIGELPVKLQAKLLRVLQEGEFEPVGSSQTKKVNVRVVAATNRALEKEIEAGKFREDLYYRLNVFPIWVPPLRERGQDIVLIAETLIEKFAKQTGREMTPLEAQDKQRLLNYPWPGNVRELQNIVERGLILSQNGKIDWTALLPSPDPAGVSLADTNRVLTENEMLELERKNILLALERCDWKISGIDGAAHLLQLPATTLYSRINKLNIEKL